VLLLGRLGDFHKQTDTNTTTHTHNENKEMAAQLIMSGELGKKGRDGEGR
jgi:hypothetical protein